MGFRSGFVAIVGSPNAGKSTLMNSFIGTKVAIVSNKAQTTRNKIVGILTGGDYQIVFLDTPGIHMPKNRLGEYMVKTAYEAASDVDMTIMVIDGKIGIRERDESIIRDGGFYNLTAVINKTDLGMDTSFMEKKLADLGVEHVYKISALKGDGVDELLKSIVAELPEGPMYYPADAITDRPERFVAAELIREKALINLRDEIPHGIGVTIEKIEESESLTHIAALIYCERDSHKSIVIGKKGAMLKKIGSEARPDLEMLFGTKVFLELWVKVKKDWRNSGIMLKELGYRD